MSVICSCCCDAAISFTKDTPRFKDELDTMKFICKDFWSALYKKQIDNLRTNHQVHHGSHLCFLLCSVQIESHPYFYLDCILLPIRMYVKTVIFLKFVCVNDHGWTICSRIFVSFSGVHGDLFRAVEFVAQLCLFY